ncbi:MAG: nucleotidyl transferase AbiEii/AbiGii toxin family protein [Propionibacteriaceae bacterium]|jgi:hypothetical protein|nr:nucleotidyl transferase AbiEii/AbiGii toxin family protein [Propionibacteriaceae bacterium]
MSQITRGTPAGQAYLDLQNQARRSHRPTDELHQLYALEGFVARLASSPVANSFVLKGGVLLAAFASRRPTRDVDLAASGISNEVESMLELVQQILAVTLPEDDGLTFDTTTLTAEPIRDEDEYPGVRVNILAHLASAVIRFHVDINVGDPIWPAPQLIALPRLRGGNPIIMTGYPPYMVHAEKIVTAVQRGPTNTRWRDFADIWMLAQRQPLEGLVLEQAIQQVSAHRKAQLRPLTELLHGYDKAGQSKWAAWRRRQRFDHLPEQFHIVLQAVISFADPPLNSKTDGLIWDPEQWIWRQP